MNARKDMEGVPGPLAARRRREAASGKLSIEDTVCLDRYGLRLRVAGARTHRERVFADRAGLDLPGHGTVAAASVARALGHLLGGVALDPEAVRHVQRYGLA